MARVALRSEVYMAQADGMLVFLDLAADRYCALNSSVSARLSPHLARDGEGVDPDMIERLRRARLITDDECSRTFAPTIAVAPVREVHRTQSVSIVESANAALCRLLAERSLRRRHIAQVVRARRNWRIGRSGRSAKDAEKELSQKAAHFLSSRALRGGRDACLKEALALLYHLGERGAAADWVFAVKGAPFAAHCWVQLDDIVLNDSVENVAAYTPIMVA